MIEKIIDRLKKARKIKGLEQKEVAEKIGISRAGYSRMETGKVEITTKNLVKIATILDISMDWLILGKEEDLKKPGLSLNFSDFGKYSGVVELMFNEIKENETTMHCLLSFFFEMKAGKNQKSGKRMVNSV